MDAIARLRYVQQTCETVCSIRLLSRNEISRQHGAKFCASDTLAATATTCTVVPVPPRSTRCAVHALCR